MMELEGWRRYASKLDAASATIKNYEHQRPDMAAALQAARDILGRPLEADYGTLEYLYALEDLETAEKYSHPVLF